jgi:hypothetical protein
MPTAIASFRLDFVRDTEENTWQYIMVLIERVVEPEPGQPTILPDSTGPPVDCSLVEISGWTAVVNA